MTILTLAWLVCIFSAITLQDIERQANEITTFRQLQETRTAGLLALIDEETGIRGYVATRDPLFLDIYRNGSRRYVASLHAFDPKAAGRGDLPHVYGERVAQAKLVDRYFLREIDLTRTGRTATAVAELARGKALFDRFRSLDKHVSNSLHVSLVHIRAVFRESLARIIGDLWIAGAVFFVLGSILACSIAASRRVEHEAGRDSLTGLANRRAFDAYLARATGDAGVLILDLNGFKRVNDRFGHAAGDALLRAVAQRLAATVRGGDLIARLGGDEFAVVFRAHEGAADILARRIQTALAVPFRLTDGTPISCTASVGVGETSSSVLATEIVGIADRRMYEDKRLRYATASSDPIVHEMTAGVPQPN